MDGIVRVNSNLQVSNERTKTMTEWCSASGMWSPSDESLRDFGCCLSRRAYRYGVLGGTTEGNSVKAKTRRSSRSPNQNSGQVPQAALRELDDFVPPCLSFCITLFLRVAISCPNSSVCWPACSI